MHRRLMFVLASLLLLPCFLFAQDGKVRGRVTAKESGEALIGANVVLDGTTLGAAADINGDFVILSVPPGVYTVRATYIGYQTVGIANVRVSANLTTTQDFQLPSSAIAVEAMEIIAERPLIQRNTTNTVRLTTAEDIENLPVRGVQNILALNAGTVLQDGELHVRGSRANEVAYYVDGATATNPYSNEENITVIDEAIEELQLQSGGFTAELGGANSAVVRTTVKTGGSSFKATVNYLTDDFAKSGEEFLGTTSRGFRNAAVTLSGPLLGSKTRFFLAGQHNYFRNRTPIFIEPFNTNNFVDPATGQTLAELGGLTDDGLEGRVAGSPLPAPIAFKKNFLPNNQLRDNSLNGTLVYDMSSALKFRLTGTYGYNRRPLGYNTFNNALNNIFWQREQRREIKTGMVALKGTHVINPKTFYEVNVSYSARNSRDFDPDFGDEWTKYSDVREWAAAGLDTSSWGRNNTTRQLNVFQGPYQHSTILNFEVKAANGTVNTYAKDEQQSLGAALDFTSQVTKNFELKFGGRADRWTMRAYSVNDIRGYMDFLYGIDGTTNRSFTDDYVRRVELAKAGNIQTYGFDIDGVNKVDSGINGPRNPLFASAYVQSKLEYRDLIINLGVRYERLDAKVLQPDNVSNPTYDKTNLWIDENSVIETEANDYLLPRINFAFPVTDRTVFYAQYGKYVQMPNLNDLYRGGIRTLSRDVIPETRSLYGFFGQYVGFTAKPERTEQYELGIRQSLTDNFALTITTFYKDMQDLLRLDRVVADGSGAQAAGTPIIAGWINNDFATSKGLELTLELRRTKRLAAKVSHTISDTRGTGSDSRSTRVSVSDATLATYPTLIYRLNYNQTHRGTMSIDYRFAQNDGGPILQGVGISALVNYNSGHNYTKILEPQVLGQANPWNVGVRATIDPRTRNPVEPVNSSSTPWNANVDLTLDKVVGLGKVNARFYANILNLFNTKSIINVYETTGTSNDDGWLKSALAGQYVATPYYSDFYKAINLDNRWGYFLATGDDIFGSPREFRLGLMLEFF